MQVRGLGGGVSEVCVGTGETQYGAGNGRWDGKVGQALLLGPCGSLRPGFHAKASKRYAHCTFQVEGDFQYEPRKTD